MTLSDFHHPSWSATSLLARLPHYDLWLLTQGPPDAPEKDFLPFLMLLLSISLETAMSISSSATVSRGTNELFNKNEGITGAGHDALLCLWREPIVKACLHPTAANCCIMKLQALQGVSTLYSALLTIFIWISGISRWYNDQLMESRCYTLLLGKTR